MHETECCKSWQRERLGYAIDCAHVTFIAAQGGAWEQGYTPPLNSSMNGLRLCHHDRGARLS